MRVLLGVALALLLTVPAVAKGQPQPLTFQTERNFTQLTLDHQGCWTCDPPWYVVNPTEAPNMALGMAPCAWNDQDDVMRRGDGYVEGTVTDRVCLFADLDERCCGNRPHSVYVNVYAASDSLQVSLANDAGHSWTAAPSIASGNQRLWRICVPDPVADRADSPPFYYWPEVPDSNGGRAQRVTYTLSLTALGRRARDVIAFLEVAGSGPTWAAPRAITNCP